MPGLDDILDGLEKELVLERELGVRSLECDRTLLAPPAAAPKGPGTAPRPYERAAPSAQPAPAQPAQPAPAVPVTGDLAAIAAQISTCRKCGLYGQRTKTVPGQGNSAQPDFMFIGEAPGQEEDSQGLAFVGAAGKLLTKMIAATGYTRDQIFIANVCKCRPPHNRTPTPEEMAVCMPYLQRQIELVRPRVIILLGRTAMNGLFPETRIRRGVWYDYHGTPVIATFHPAYLLRFDSFNDQTGLRAAKLEVWGILKSALAKIGKKPPERKKATAP